MLWAPWTCWWLEMDMGHLLSDYPGEFKKDLDCDLTQITRRWQVLGVVGLRFGT